MKYNLDGKEIRIPDEEIKRYVETMHITEEEAIQIYLEDEGYLENEEQEALCAKAKENRVTAHLGARQNVENKKTERERKANPVKENLIAILAETLEKQDNLINIKVTNVGKIIEFTDKEGNNFKLDLIQKRQKKG